MTITKATEYEQGTYRGVYPLYGSVLIDGIRCDIEYLRGCDPDIKYEIIAPEGKLFTGNDPGGLHTLLCHDYRDLRDRAGAESKNTIVDDPEVR